MKVLIMRFSSIGDIVLTTPIIRCIKQTYPHAEIHFLTKDKYKDILEHNPYVHTIHTFHSDIQSIIYTLLNEKYTHIVDLHKNIRSFYVKSILTQAFNSNIQKFSFNKLNIRKWLYVNFKINLLPDKSIVNRYFDGLKKWQVKNDGKGLDYFTNPEKEIKTDDLPLSHVYGFIACGIGAQHYTKKMPVEKWQTLCKEIDFPIVLLGGKEDFDNAEKIRESDPIKTYNACGKFSLDESAQIIRKSKAVISHDTAVMHIGAAMKKPIISIWGNTTPYLGMFPYMGYNNIITHKSPDVHIIENNKLWCRPCSKIGHKSCPKKHFKCMQTIDLQKLVTITKQYCKKSEA